ncbi:PRD domain-containing protein [Bacillus licheniformis]|nr:PRD domain-containing protein [Bacillus licheniformis]
MYMITVIISGHGNFLIAFPEEEEMNDQLENVLHITEKTLKPYEEKLGLAISEDEKMFIASIFAEEL